MTDGRQESRLESEYLDSRNAARALRCSIGTIRNYVKAGQLTPVRLGSRHFFRAADLERLLDSGTDSRYTTIMRAKRSKAAAQVAARREAGESIEPHATIRARHTLAFLWTHHDELAAAADGVASSLKGATRAERVQALAAAFEDVAAGAAMKRAKYVNWRSLAFAWIEAFGDTTNAESN